MARIVMCWELGGDLGHIARMKPLAEALHARGHEVSFIVRETIGAERLLDPGKFRWLQAPIQPEAVRPGKLPTLNFTHVMHNVGFHDARALLGRMRAWRNLYDSLGAELLVFDHSPTALLAARGYPARRILLGTGFGVPPVAYPLPAFMTGTDAATLMADEDIVAARINEALAALGAPGIGRVAELYASDAKVVFSLRELDHYGAREDVEYWGPTAQNTGLAPDWPAAEGRRVFAYLKPFKTLPSLLTTLKEAGHPTLVYLKEANPEVAQQYGSERLRFTTRPVDLRSTVKDAAVVICHSGHGTVSAALLAGKPLLALPLNLEQTMLATRVEAAGAGLAAPALAPQGMAQKFQRLLAEPTFSAAAGAFAERYRALDVESSPARFAALTERLLKS